MDEITNTKTESSVVTEATTTFIENGTRVEAVYTSAFDGDDITVKDQGIVDFMRKPVQYSNAAWVINTYTTLETINIGTFLASQAIWTDKLRGFTLYRGTFCVQVQINATPFHQGKLLISWLPGMPQGYNADPSFLNMRTAGVASTNNSLAGLRQLPCVELDCRETSAIMKVPYITPMNWYNPKVNSYDWGRVTVNILAPLQVGTGGDQNIRYTVWCWFEDFEMAAPAVPQSGVGKATKKHRMKTFGTSTTDKEADGMGVGAVSKGLSSVSVAANALADIPMLEPVARPAAWVADVLGGIASQFGWSKPDNNAAPQTILNNWNRYAATSDGPDSAIPLSLRVSHGVGVSNGFSIRDEDEMSFAFLKSIPTVTNALSTQVINWSDTNAEDTSLLSYLVHPGPPNGTGGVVNGGLWETSTISYNSHTATWIRGPPFVYLAQKFAFWRGSFKLTIKFVKTDFHSGRLAVTWTPGHYVDVAPTHATSQYSIREIIDLKEANEISFVLPWLVETNYLPICPIGQTVQGLNGYSGQLDIVVLNQLVAPATCNSSVQLLMYWSAGDDFELAGTGPWSYLGGGWNAQNFAPQMNSVGETGDEKLPPGAITTNQSNSFQIEASQQSIGEMFSSVKQILARYQPVQISSSALFSSTAVRFVYWPWHCNVPYLNQSTGAFTGNPAGNDFYSYIAPMYLFYRGDMKVQMDFSTSAGSASVYPSNHKVTAMAYPYPNLTAAGNELTVSNTASAYVPRAAVAWQGAYPGSGISALGSGGAHVLQAGVGVDTWRVPYYNTLKTSYVIPTTTSLGRPFEPSQSTTVLEVDAIAGTFTDYALYRAVADDFQFSFFLCAPPILIKYV